MSPLSVNVADELVERIAEHIDSPRSRVYALVSARRIPVHHDGSALIAQRSEIGSEAPEKLVEKRLGLGTL